MNTPFMEVKVGNMLMNHSIKHWRMGIIHWTNIVFQIT